MFKKLLIFAAAASAFAFATPAYAATKADAMRWEAAYQALSVVDVAQTVTCLKRDICEETNPLFGSNPKAWKLVAAKLAVGTFHYAIVDRLADQDPKLALRVAQVSVALQGGVVMLNARVFF